MIQDSRERAGGFTLVEMMVVIAVIGILAAAVLGGLLPARTKARDSRIISAVQQARAIIESAFNPTSGAYPAAAGGAPALGGTYSTQYGPADGSAGLTKEVKDQGGTLRYTTSGVGYTVSARLNNNDYYCVDSAGTVKQGGGNPADGAAQCP